MSFKASTPGVKKKAEHLLVLFLHQPWPIETATKIIKAHVCLTANQKALPKRLKIAPTTYPKIAGNVSMAFKGIL